MTARQPTAGPSHSYAALRPDRAPSPLVLDALDLLGGRTGRALDIGAGPLSDTRYLLQAGFAVDVVDPDEETIACAARLGDPRLTAVRGDIREVTILPGRYDLILALHVLPFLPRDDLGRVISAVRDGLADGGLFCCTLFGVNDSWAGRYRLSTFLTRPEVDALLTDLHPIKLTEREYDGHDAHRTPKHWHVFRAILRAQPAESGAGACPGRA